MCTGQNRPPPLTGIVHATRNRKNIYSQVNSAVGDLTLGWPDLTVTNYRSAICLVGYNYLPVESDECLVCIHIQVHPRFITRFDSIFKKSNFCQPNSRQDALFHDWHTENLVCVHGVFMTLSNYISTFLSNRHFFFVSEFLY